MNLYVRVRAFFIGELGGKDMDYLERRWRMRNEQRELGKIEREEMPDSLDYIQAILAGHRCSCGDEINWKDACPACGKVVLGCLSCHQETHTMENSILTDSDFRAKEAI